uniref:Uncharacterized protein n=1 Tax=viral metagenome TaxID=1070528 RepID=A0A6C0JVV0_9ZZZZ
MCLKKECVFIKIMEDDDGWRYVQHYDTDGNVINVQIYKG